MNIFNLLGSYRQDLFFQSTLNRNNDRQTQPFDKVSIVATAAFALPPLIESNLLRHKTPFNHLIQRSNEFHQLHHFPTSSNRASSIATSVTIENEIIKNAQATYPIIHEHTFTLINDFLEYYKIYGTPAEQTLYATMNAEQFINRLLKCRPLMFMTKNDHYLLQDGSIGKRGFEDIGTMQEKAPLVLRKYLSYKEMEISALIGISSPTHFINDGNRNNKSIQGHPGSFEQTGVYTGLVGARFERPGSMEWRHMMITPEQNTSVNGYGKTTPANMKAGSLKMWEKYYETTFPTYKEAALDTSGKYFPISEERYINIEVYKRRLKNVLLPFLSDANQRAREKGVTAYVHAVGLGLGVWQVTPMQAQWMLQAYAELIAQYEFKYISDINFSYFPSFCTTCGGIPHGKIMTSNKNHIKIHFSQRNPAEKLSNEDTGKLLVASYAWDSNSFPGNEYWLGALKESGDPAAACCSMIAELQNPFINPYLSARQTRMATASKFCKAIVSTTTLDSSYEPLKSLSNPKPKLPPLVKSSQNILPRANLVSLQDRA